MKESSRTGLDVLVIGAGQAGLAAGRALASNGLSFHIQERHAYSGDSWRRRYDSLTLFSPRSYSALPGLPLSGDPEGYPAGHEIADYLGRYARTFELPLALGDAVIALERQGGRFSARTAQGRSLEATAVIVATGGFERPVTPSFAANLAPGLPRFDAASYRRPEQVPPGRVLVVGGGPTGRNVARELASTHETWLSTGRRSVILPQRILGRDNLWWADHLGALRADKATVPGRVSRALDPFPGAHLRPGSLRRRGVRLVPRTIDADGATLRFAGGRAAAFDAVVWAIGYRDDPSWMSIPGATGAHGSFLEHRGLSPVPGLFYVGREWQNSRASGLLCGVADDAEKIVRQVRRFLSEPTALPGPG